MVVTDWKNALASLVSFSDSYEPDKQKDIDSKKRTGIVYSTNTEFEYSENSKKEETTLPKKQQRLRLNIERAGRGGKTVTLVKGFVGSYEDMNALCKLLKHKCGVGGSVKNGEIIIQGELRERLADILKKEGYLQTK